MPKYAVTYYVTPRQNIVEEAVVTADTVQHTYDGVAFYVEGNEIPVAFFKSIVRYVNLENV